MKKIRRQIIALFLCMAMVITVLPVHIKSGCGNGGDKYSFCVRRIYMWK